MLATSLLTTDIRCALRLWRRTPGFALTVVLVLSMGIGATTAVFSVVDALLLRPLSHPDAARLVVIHAVLPEQRNNPTFRTSTDGRSPSAWNRAPISPPAWEDLKDTPAFEEVGVWYYPPRPHIIGEERTGVIDIMYASASLLPLLGVRPLLGRLFTADEDFRSDALTLILSYETWQGRFAGRDDVLGETMWIAESVGSGSRAWTIVGVLPPGFSLEGLSPEVLKPFRMSGDLRPTRYLRAMARLAPGVSLEAASEAADPLIRRYEPPERRAVRLVPLEEEMRGKAAPLWLMFGGTGLLLLVACSNAAALLLGRVRARRHEIAVRMAIGCSRWRVLRQLGIEHLLLGMTAAVSGLVLAAWLTPVLVAMGPVRLPGLEDVGINLRVAGFAMGLGLLTTLAFGLGPAAVLVSTRAAETLSDGGWNATPGGRFRHRAMIAAQVGLTLVLLVAASLFGETMFRLRSQPLGFDPAGLAVVHLRFTQRPDWWRSPPALSRAGVEQDVQDRRALLYTTGLIERLSALPGVIAAAGMEMAPFGGEWRILNVRAPGRSEDEEQSVQLHLVTEGYFQTMGLPVLQGRSFEPSDLESTAVVAVVSQEFERRVLDGAAIGRQFMTRSTTYRVIGVVPNAKQREFYEEGLATFYAVPRGVGAIRNLMVRMSGDTVELIPLVRQTIQDYDSNLVITSTTMMEEVLAASLEEERFRAVLSAVFGGVALVLAATGLFGLAARNVAERRREIGVRMALGARPHDVRVLVLRDAWMTLGLGLMAGLPAAYGASQVMRSLLFGVSPTAPHVFLGAMGVLATVALVATLLPAQRASRIDPMLALRE